jgi:hypothetical protein
MLRLLARVGQSIPRAKAFYQCCSSHGWLSSFDCPKKKGPLLEITAKLARQVGLLLARRDGRGHHDDFARCSCFRMAKPLSGTEMSSTTSPTDKELAKPSLCTMMSASTGTQSRGSGLPYDLLSLDSWRGLVLGVTGPTVDRKPNAVPQHLDDEDHSAQY